MTHNLVLRLATAQDALCVGALGTQVWLNTYATDGIRPSLAREVIDSFSVDALSVTLARPDTVLILAEQHGHLIGFAQFRYRATHALIVAGSAVELERLYVQESFTGKGIGKRLLQQVETLITSQGVERIWLTAWVHNRRALGFYAAQGYEDVGSDYYTFDGEEHENRVFGKRLVLT